MIGTIRRHSQSLWWIIVVAMIISFVWFYGSNSASLESLLTSAGRGGSAAKIYGEPVSQAMVTSARRQVEFNHFLQDRNNPQRRPRTEDQTRSEVYQQILLQKELEANGVIPGEQALAVALRDEFKNQQTGTATAAEVRAGYEQFLKGLERTSFDEADFATLLRSQVGLGHLRELMSVPAALVTPREAMAEFRRDNELVATSAVVFNPSNYLASVALTDAAIGQFYTNNLARYRTEERVGMNYARFDATNHLAEVEAAVTKNPGFTNSLLESYMKQTNQNASAFQDPDGRPLSREAALGQIRADTIRAGALQLAYKDAAQFYNALGKQKVTAEGFVDFAKTAAFGATLGATPAVTGVAMQPPFAELRGAQEALSRLNPANPFSTPLDSKDSIVIAAFRERVPSTIQPLDVVKARVQTDYQRQESINAARIGARAFLVQVTNGLAAGKSFADLAKAQNLVPVELPAFSSAMNTLEGLPPGLSVFELKNSLGSAKAGDVQLLDQGLPVVAMVRERRPVAEETVKAGLNSFMEEIRQRRQFSVFNEWFRQKYEASGLAAVLNPKTAGEEGR